MSQKELHPCITEAPAGDSGLVLVRGLRDSTNQFTMCKYFENHCRSSGGAVTSVRLITKHKAAIIEFKDKDGMNLLIKHDDGYIQMKLHLTEKCII